MPTTRTRGRTTLANLVGVVFALVMAFPVYWMLNTAFKPSDEILTFTPVFFPRHPTLDNFTSALKAPNFLIDLRNSLIITVFSVAASLVVGFLGALAVARFRFYGRRALILVILRGADGAVHRADHPAVPDAERGAADRHAARRDHHVPGASSCPTRSGCCAASSPTFPGSSTRRPWSTAASRWQSFYRIILPLTGPGLVATSIYGFIQAWNEFIIINTLNNAKH